MKTLLPERSLVIKPLLDRVTSEILIAGKNTIAMIILFGSYARGDWVSDEYTEGHITYSYQSDLDIMVVLKKGKHIAYAEPRIEKRLERELVHDLFSKKPWITLIFESIDYVNRQLERGRYFYSDIKKEGALLYDSGEFTLSEVKELSSVQRREIAKEDFEQWFESGSEFLIDTLNALQRNSLNRGAFYLHQATESFYSAIMLVFSGYKIKLHDIRKLGSLAGNYNAELWQVFPHSSIDQRQAFKLLERAYIEARYSKEYKISREQLTFLIERVNKLQNLTERICLEYINAS
ncbi:nucleotidyltransferase (plasmid) [Candidatus Megaera polyxenophila]|nr:nucleotidyltransferase [Candidatus Megaera polyxenophila]